MDPSSPGDSRSRDFEVHEMFFSTTDPRGTITAGNDVFVRVSGYSTAELLGQPHNVIRHPDMPRGAFALLWERVRQGQPFCGYVKNRAKDGTHYWVFAVVVPIPDGFLSIRFKPTSPTRATVETVYARMCAAEAAAIAGGAKAAAAARIALPQLEEQLRQLGHASYDAFSHAALNLEMRARDQALAARRIALFPADLPAAEARPQRLYHTGVATFRALDTLFRDLTGFARCSHALQEQAASILELSERFRLNALNANIASAPLGPDGAGLSTVAGFLSDSAVQLATRVGGMAAHVRDAARATDTLTSATAMARLQLEMMLVFIAEVVDGTGGTPDGDQERLIRLLHALERALAGTTRQAVEALAALDAKIPAITTSSELLRKSVLALQLSQVAGLTESARIDASRQLGTMFQGFREQITEAQRRLGALDEVLAEFLTLTRATPAKVAAMGRSATLLREQVAALAAPD